MIRLRPPVFVRHLLFALVFLLTPLARAALQAELAPGIRYLRPDGAPADREILATAWQAQPITLLDLRYLGDDTTLDLPKLLAMPPASTRIVLLDDHPPGDITALLSSGLPKILTIGPKSLQPAPDIAVDLAPDADRAAFDAASRGTALADLLGKPPEKTRYDEAAMVADYANHDERTAPASSPPAASSTPPAKAPPKPSPPVDPLLVRALHLAEGLRALSS